jgi:hypothetical protein
MAASTAFSKRARASGRASDLAGDFGMVTRKSFKGLYAIPASETEEGKARIAEYHIALGRFVDMFSRAEIATQYTLRSYAKLSANRAQILFYGTRTDPGADLIKSFAKEDGASKEILEDLTYVFAQLRAITTTRNSILHWGAKQVAEGTAYVFTGLEGVAPTAKSARHFPISPAILDQMTADLSKIIMALAYRHMGRPSLKAKILRDGIEAALKEPWLYRPPQPRPQDSQDTPQKPKS